MPCQKKRGVRRFFFFCPKMHYAPGWGGNGDKNSTPTELFWAGTKLGHPQKPQVFQFCSGPVYFCLRIVTAQNKYFYGTCRRAECWRVVDYIFSEWSSTAHPVFFPIAITCFFLRQLPCKGCRGGNENISELCGAFYGLRDDTR